MRTGSVFSTSVKRPHQKLFRRLAGMSFGLLLLVAQPTEAQQNRLADPMRPFVPREPSSSGEAREQGLNLTAVLVSEHRRIAVINGVFYREGDTVAGAVVTRIEREAVHFERRGQSLVVRLNSERTKLSPRSGDSLS
jgi:hypothetical protein